MKAELYILGVLHRGNFHPYEIKRRLTQAMIECFTDVDVGTLYYAVRQLAESGLLAAIARQRVARGSAHPNRQAECAAGGDPEIASAMDNEAAHG